MDFEQYSPINIQPQDLTIPFLKNHLQAFSDWQLEQFKAKQHINDIVAMRALYVDELLGRLWDLVGLDESYDLSLLAVGGYGRGELHPKSDIDVLILSDHGFSQASEEKIGQLITLLWDLKLDVGNSVRTIQDCIEQGKADITIATSMIESRLLKGNQQTFDKLQEVIAEDDFWPSDKFFTIKKEEQFGRHKNCRGDGYTLEPDIKNGCGGLRDIQTIAWVSKRHFDAQSLLELTSYGYITQAEYHEISDCQSQLWTIRFALHTVTNRPDNRLLFDFQSDVAKLLGYTGQRNEAVEQMMKMFYQTIRRVKELNEMLLQYFDEAILGNVATEFHEIDEHFRIRGNKIELTTSGYFQENPEAIIQLFVHIADDTRIKGIYSATLRELREARRCLTHWLQNIPECRSVFMEIIKHPRGMGLPFTLMYEHGVLAAYIPQWSRIVGQMQFDLFHAYTVDAHTHKLAKLINNYPNSKVEHPLAHEIFKNLEKPELLFLATIFHDIAKGQQGDHSTLGAVDALAFCGLHGLTRYESKVVAWLVEHHLTMSVTAQRRDISDPNVIIEFAKTVRDEKHLNLLYCLTVADICATNEDTWNSWKASLLRDLYYKTLTMLRRGLENPPDVRDRIRDRQFKALAILAEQGISEAQVRPLWKRFRLNYFFRYTSAQICWHTKHLLAHQDHERPLVLISTENTRGSEIFVYSKDIRTLFSSVVTEIDNKKLSVQDAKILSSRDNYSLSTFTVLEEDGEHIDVDKIQRVKEAIIDTLLKPHIVNSNIIRLERVKRPFKFEPQITFLPTRRKRTQIEVVAFDAPGILANIGTVFVEHGLMLDTAKITTIGERAEDLFIVSTVEGDALTKEQEDALKTSLMYELSPST
ncbi:[protein-PII] uridylyltransferase [Psychromonas sp. 14N.309.X.WAT.B.A12]|uniref:[protein-PII] uridylyltransferase n=1 Tax=unclassified Psychromonas TaxID=2614957 RepID=UPI0025B0A394|nr:[protein-PII] uridylyltransferase [Psychromonas sp. 14N.309.X.WAT.B.A12]MDN2662890.1 [protein-PII] uridylyltransferase [Psychromonas sp. 14N.309.X.WAT.B.A12]